MKATERRAAWEALGVVEDWLAGGIRVVRAIPDFPDTSIVLPRPPSPEEGLAEIAREVEACRACALCEKRKRAVPGQGPSRPIAMVVGEGPGAEEDERGLPFVGPAGQLLDKMLAAIGLDRASNCYIANAVKCRPPQNRDPSPDEREACLPYLRRQIALLRPKAILCAGRVAAQSLLGATEGVGKLRGAWKSFEGTPVLVTYHPSALLRDDSYKRPAWEDLKMFRERITAEE
jgi:DNA polymerase